MPTPRPSTGPPPRSAAGHAAWPTSPTSRSTTLVSGVILDHFAWRWIDLLTIPVALLAMVFAARLLPDSRAPARPQAGLAGQIDNPVDDPLHYI